VSAAIPCTSAGDTPATTGALFPTKKSAGRIFTSSALLLNGIRCYFVELSGLLPHGNRELDGAVLKIDHERAGVTRRVQIATIYVKLPVESLDPLYSRRKRAIELSAVRSNF
jgi:hypothetical protein